MTKNQQLRFDLPLSLQGKLSTIISRVELNILIYISDLYLDLNQAIKIRNIICSFKALCDFYDTASVKSQIFMSNNCKNEMWTEITNPCRLRKSELLECHKFESADWDKVKVVSKFHQTCRCLTVDLVLIKIFLIQNNISKFSVCHAYKLYFCKSQTSKSCISNFEVAALEVNLKFAQKNYVEIIL